MVPLGFTRVSELEGCATTLKYGVVRKGMRARPNAVVWYIQDINRMLLVLHSVTLVLSADPWWCLRCLELLPKTTFFIFRNVRLMVGPSAGSVVAPRVVPHRIQHVF